MPATDPPRARRGRPVARAAQELLAPKPAWIPPTPGVFEITTGIVTGTAAALASPLLVKPLQMALGPLASDPATYQPTPEEMGDPGWFGPNSVAWRVHADHSLLVAGIAAFTLQALHPLAMAGVAEHSAFSDDFLGRTRRTGEFVQGVVYGSSTEADRLCRTVRKVHQRVEGVAPDGDTICKLQDHVKATIAPYKYPRSVKFIEALPRTQTGKIQRFRLRPGHNETRSIA